MNKILIQNIESQSFIRHCWVYSVYKKKLINVFIKEKFINFLTKDGKKSKAYNIFNQTGIILRKILLNKNKFLFLDQTMLDQKVENHKKRIQLLKSMFCENRLIKRKVKIKKKVKNLLFLISIKNKRQRLNLKKKKEFFNFNHFLIQVIDNVKPNLEIRKVKIGRTTYLVPAIIAKNRQQSLAIKWIINSARLKKRGTKESFAQILANELVDGFLKQGQARQKRDDLHKLAEANRAYVRYRWW